VAVELVGGHGVAGEIGQKGGVTLVGPQAGLAAVGGAGAPTDKTAPVEIVSARGVPEVAHGH